jgi:hypothetical protein
MPYARAICIPESNDPSPCSIGRTCRVNDVEPYGYLNYLFEQLPLATTVGQIEALLPWNVKIVLDEQKKKSPESAQPSLA